MLHTLYVRGRHNMSSTITATHKFNALSPLIRVNASGLYVFQLRNMKDLECMIDEVSAVLDKTDTTRIIPHSNICTLFIPLC